MPWSEKGARLDTFGAALVNRFTLGGVGVTVVLFNDENGGGTFKSLII
jgi:hypothetical protein